MSFPTIPTTGAGRVLSNTQADASGTRTFPSLSSLTKNSGDLLVAIIIAYQSGGTAGAVFSSWGGGFTERADLMTTSGSTMCIGVATKVSDGTETGTFTVTQASPVGHAAMFLLSIPGADAGTVIEIGPIADGTSTAADPGSFDPSGWGAEDTLWISVACSGETSTAGAYQGLNSGPTNYGSDVQSGISGDVVGGVEGGVSFRQLNAASEDVGTWGLDTSNARNSALIIAVRPTPPQIISQSSVVHTRGIGTPSVGHLLHASSPVVHTRAFGTPVLPARGEVAWAQMQIPPVSSGAQTITPTGLVHTRAFGTAAISVGEVFISPASVAHSRDVPTGAQINQTIAPPSVVHTRAFGTADILEGAVMVQPSGVVHTRAYGVPLIILYITPSGVVHTRAFGTAIVAEGGGDQDLFPQPVVHTRAIGDATVLRGTVSITPASVVHTRAFGTTIINPRRGVVSWAQLQLPPVFLIITPSGVVHARAFGTAIVQNSSIAPSSVVHTRAFGAPNVIGEQDVFPASVVHTRAFGDAQIGLEPHIAAAGLVWLWGDVDFGVIEPISVVHVRGFGSLRVNQAIAPSSVVHTRAFGTPTVGGYIVPPSVVHTRAFGSPALKQLITLGARDTGFKPGAAVGNIAGGNPDWAPIPSGSFVANLLDEDSMVARVTLASIQNSDLLAVTDLKLNVTGQILGFEVEVVIDAIPAFADLFVSLTKNGTTVVGSFRSIDNPTAGTYVVGGPTDLFGTSWSEAEVEASTFGVMIEADNDTTAGDVDIDRVRVKVYTASTAPVHQRVVGNPTVGAAVTTLLPSSVTHSRNFGTPTVSVSAFPQTISTASVVHSRNITGPVVHVTGDPFPQRVKINTMQWGIETIRREDVKVDSGR